MRPSADAIRANGLPQIVPDSCGSLMSFVVGLSVERSTRSIW